MFYLTTHSTHFIYGYMASDIWLRTILIVRTETRCRHIGYSYRLTARVLLYAPSHRQDNTYHGLCYTSRGALAGTRNSLMGERNDVISQDVIPVINDIYYATANMECCSLMITDPAPHHDTPPAPSIRLDKAVTVISFSTPTPHLQPNISIP